MAELVSKCKAHFAVVVAFCDKNQGMSYQGGIPWPYNRLDHEFYMNLITSTSHSDRKNGVMLGRLCWETMAEEDKHKISIVVTSTSMLTKDRPALCQAVAPSYDAAMEELLKGVRDGRLEKVWVLGGRQNYQEAVDDPRVTQIIVTRIFKEFSVDGFFPKFKHKFHLVSSSDVQMDSDVPLQFETWERISTNS